MAEDETVDGAGETQPTATTTLPPEDAEATTRASEHETETREADLEIEARQRRAESLKGTLEHRSFSVEGLEVRSLDDGTIRMSGYASVTETPYQVGKFKETIKRGAFKRTLSENPHVVLLFGHDGMPYASTKNGSLALTEDARGLQWTADLDDQDPDSKVLARKVEQGLIDECSFAFQVTDQDWSADFSDRSVKALSMHKGDVSLVVAGANPETSVSLREMVEEFEVRAGKKLSAATKAELQGVVDKITGLLADKTGDDDETASEAAGDEREAETETPRYMPDMAARHRLRLMARNGGQR